MDLGAAVSAQEDENDFYSMLNSSLFPQLLSRSDDLEAEFPSNRPKGTGPIDQEIIDVSFKVNLTEMLSIIENDESKTQNENSSQPQTELISQPTLNFEVLEARSAKKKRRKYEKRSQNFDALGIRSAVFTKYMKEIFLGQKADDLTSFELNALEQKLGNLIIEKKAKAHKDFDVFSTSEVNFNRTSKKRVEENLKFAFKRILKNICTDYSFPSQKELFAHFFSKKSKQNSIDLERYWTPKSTDHPANHLSFTQTYARLLNQSKPFVNEVNKQIELFLNPAELKKLISKNIDKFFKNLALKFSKEENLISIEKYISSSKCKLPWTAAEAGIAAASLKRYIND